MAQPSVTSVAASPDGMLLAATYADRWLRIWQVSSGAAIGANNSQRGDSNKNLSSFGEPQSPLTHVNAFQGKWKKWVQGAHGKGKGKGKPGGSGDPSIGGTSSSSNAN